jgi:mannose-P-dolichol utilization defect protein 1
MARWVATVQTMFLLLLVQQSWHGSIAFAPPQPSSASTTATKNRFSKDLATNPLHRLMSNDETNAASLSLSSSTTTALSMQMDGNLIAETLGYAVGAASLFLYTPIALRVVRQQSADGLSLSTWWFKLSAFTCSDLYATSQGYPLSQYIDWIAITAEVIVNLCVVSYFQNKMDKQFFINASVFAMTALALSQYAPPEVLALGQLGSTALNAGALLPQFMLNAKLRTAGDYSPVTAFIGAAGCAARLYTTMQLADGDMLLLASFGFTFCLNTAMLLQILWYGVMVEEREIMCVLTADLAGPRRATTTTTKEAIATQS